MNYSLRRLLKFSVVIGCILLAGCTIIREVESNDDDDDGNGDHPYDYIYDDIPFDDDTRIVDALVVVDLDRGSSQIMGAYYDYLDTVRFALAMENVFVRDLAVAPMYGRQNHHPPLLYGEGADNNMGSLDQTLEYYVTDGHDHLDDRVDAPAENLAAIGLGIGSEPIYNPQDGAGDGSAYFTEAEDGFVVFHMTHTARACDHGASDCHVDDKAPADYFTETTAGIADWLALPGNGLAPDDIVHVTIATEEATDFDSFADRCDSEPGFPTSHLDHLEPSEQYLYFGNFVDDLNAEGGVGDYVDLCRAFSNRALTQAGSTASTIAGSLD